jgi:hypothetical protein
MKDIKKDITDNLSVKAPTHVEREFLGVSEVLKYLNKKTERIVAALHLISNFFEKEEPMKWKIRTLSVELIIKTSELSFKLPREHKDLIEKINHHLVVLRSLLQVLQISGMISVMNHEVIDKEIGDLSLTLLNLEEEGEIKTLSAEFFKTDSGYPLSSGHLVGDKKNGENPIKDIKHKGQYINKTSRVGANFDISSNGETKNLRRNRIVSIIKKQGNVTIKDISMVVTECSEKTIQRELLAMVEDNILSKEGERRWSRYSYKA